MNYDATYRVTQCLPSRTVTTPLFQQYTENFTYDAVGNRLTGQRYGASVHSQDYTYDYENRLVRVVKHLASGNDTITFKYDPFGRRIEKNVSTVENSIPTIYKYTYVYDNEDIILEVLDKTQNAVTTTTTTSYVHGPGVDEPLSLARNGQTYYYHADGLGSITSMIDSTQAVVNRYSYDSFGNVQRAETVWNDFTFTGREYDYETGRYFLRARYYDPETGKFISKDPIGFAGGDVNLYGYVLNDSINRIDPFGLAGIKGKSPNKTWVPPDLISPSTTPTEDTGEIDYPYAPSNSTQNSCSLCEPTFHANVYWSCVGYTVSRNLDIYVLSFVGMLIPSGVTQVGGAAISIGYSYNVGYSCRRMATYCD